MRRSYCRYCEHRRTLYVFDLLTDGTKHLVLVCRDCGKRLGDALPLDSPHGAAAELVVRIESECHCEKCGRAHVNSRRALATG